MITRDATTVMGFDAYFLDDDGRRVAPPPDGDWSGWVSASSTRNYCNGETLADWLDLYGAAKGFVRDDTLPGYDANLDWTQYIFAQGHAFEAAVLALLDTRVGIYRVEVPDCDERSPVRSLAGARLTYEAMHRAEPIISQGVLWNPVDRTYGAADLLVRSDILHQLFPDAIAVEDVDAGAPGIELFRRHYRVVDIKFKGLPLNKDGQAAAALKDYMVQVHIYNQALGRIQGYTPGAAYLLGRAWHENGDRGDSCFDRLAVCRADREISGVAVASLAASAVAWVRRVRAEGGAWNAVPQPTVAELWPTKDGGSWGGAYRQIIEAIRDVIKLWQVGPGKRPRAHEGGIYHWDDPLLTPELVGVSGVNADTLSRIREVNLADDGDPIAPALITAAASEWAIPRGVEFYVDFEWSTDVNDDFSLLPRKGGNDAIFMIGCGHVEDGQWRFTCFIADDLSEEAEARTIDAWFDHMRSVRNRLAPGLDPLVFHWSHAEEINLSTSYKSAKKRHPEKNWPEPNWFDFLNRVMKQEPVVVRGAMAFGLKTVARAMKSHGCIETTWGDSVVDGMGAMVAAWRCAEAARRDGCTLFDIPLMAEVRDYNEVDCKVMMEIVRYLRSRAVA